MTALTPAQQAEMRQRAEQAAAIVKADPVYPKWAAALSGLAPALAADVLALLDRVAELEARLTEARPTGDA